MCEESVIRHYRFHTDNPVEANALELLNKMGKCKLSQPTLIAFAINEFIAKYQLQGLQEAELKGFFKSYCIFANGNKEEIESEKKLQNSLSLLRGEIAANLPVAPVTAPVSEPQKEDAVIEPVPVATAPITQEPVLTEKKKLIDPASADKMQKVLAMFQSQ